MPAAERGIALIVTLMAMALLAALGLGLSLSSSTARLASRNHEDAVFLLNAAESALELAARDLSALTDWSRALDGTARSTAVDGPAGGVRTLPDGRVIDLTRLTSELTCGRATVCTESERQATSAERPWGAANPRWRLFVHTPLHPLVLPRHPSAAYVVAWVGDDARETDGDPGVDGGSVLREGRHIVRVRADAFGSGEARRAIDAEITRDCRDSGTGDVCLPGVRILSWRSVGAPP